MVFFGEARELDCCCWCLWHRSSNGPLSRGSLSYHALLGGE